MEIITSTSKDREFGVTVLAGTGKVFQKMLSYSKVMGNNLRVGVCLAGTGGIKAVLGMTTPASSYVYLIQQQASGRARQNSNVSWLLMATQTILLHPHLPKRSDN